MTSLCRHLSAQEIVNWVTTADGCVHTDDTMKLSPTSCEFVFTLPTQQNSFVVSAVCIGHYDCVWIAAVEKGTVRLHVDISQPPSRKDRITHKSGIFVQFWCLCIVLIIRAKTQLSANFLTGVIVSGTPCSSWIHSMMRCLNALLHLEA